VIISSRNKRDIGLEEPTANFLISGEYYFFPNNYSIRISNLFELNAPIPIFGFTNKSFAVKHEAHQPILSHLDFLCPSPLLWGVTHDAYTKELEFGPTYWNANHFPSAFFSCSMEPGIIQRGEPATSK
jgi:hypothetical protein